GVRDFFKSKRIQKQWDTFGAKKFDRKKQKASKRLEDPNRELSQIHRLNYAFIEATENNQSYYFNLLDKVSLLNRKLSIAYDKNNPKAIRFQRVHLTIAQMTLQYLPLPGYVKDKMSNYLSSKYHQQMTTEAALMGYLLSQQKYAEAQMLSRQSLNPYIIMDMEKIGQNKY
ncbi:MAG: hypothetical protein KDD50_11210, partial [Bdellovibrionales bacterium]|nr:hypothetical protein [Bdellovibrionales bacterium]